MKILNLLFGFVLGKKYIYNVYYGIIGAGIAQVEIPEIIIYRDIPCYRIVASGYTNKFFSLIFNVNDRVESYIDTHNLRTIRYEKHLNEGTWKQDEYVEFFPEKEIAIYSKGDTVLLLPNSLDVAGILFMIRKMNIEVGETISVNLHLDRRNCNLKIFVEREEEIETGMGKEKAYLLKLLQGKGSCGGKSGLETIFGSKGGLSVWISKDEERKILKISAKVFFGSIRAILKEIRE